MGQAKRMKNEEVENVKCDIKATALVVFGLIVAFGAHMLQHSNRDRAQRMTIELERARWDALSEYHKACDMLSRSIEEEQVKMRFDFEKHKNGAENQHGRPDCLDLNFGFTGTVQGKTFRQGVLIDVEDDSKKTGEPAR